MKHRIVEMNSQDVRGGMRVIRETDLVVAELNRGEMRTTVLR